MKKYIWIAVALVFGACTREEFVSEPAAEQVYTMTLQATKAVVEVPTRALNWHEGKLCAQWAAGETVKVYKQEGETYTELGTLTAQSDGASAVLSGTLSGAIAKADHLALFYKSGAFSYVKQVGILYSSTGSGSIEKNYDFARGDAIVDSTDGGVITVKDMANPSSSVISFESQQAIVHFNLKYGGASLTGVDLAIFDDNKNLVYNDDVVGGTSGKGYLTINRTSSEFYVAIRSNGEMDLTLDTKDAGGQRYSFEKSGVVFEHGKYYEITVNMGKLYNFEDSPLDSDFTAHNGDFLKGYMGGKHKISIEDGATVTLRDLQVAGGSGPTGNEYPWAGLTCEGDATIILSTDGSSNSITGFNKEYPGIYVPEGKTLTIRGKASLTVQSSITDNRSGAAIGGVVDGPACGNIRIEGGTINATAGKYSAAIGGADSKACGNITITGGTITARANSYGPGIGAGDNGSCGNIEITGGTINARGGYGVPGIGASASGSCGDITIGSGVTNVTSRTDAPGTDARFSIGYSTYFNPARSTCGVISIGGTVYYDGSAFASPEFETALEADPFVYPAS